MKVYYILSTLSSEDKNFFFDSIKGIREVSDIDEIIKTRYYRIDKTTFNTTYNSITLEAWLFIKSIWCNYWVSPENINWIYKQNMVILNNDLWIYNEIDLNWDRISTEENIYFFASRFSSWNVFWSFFEELSKINKYFPKLIFPNKDLTYTRQEKITFIMNTYEKREEMIGNFMLPLLYNRSKEAIKWLLLLWKQEIWEKRILLKKSWWTDNGKHITLLDVDEYINNDQKLDYLFLKYISYTSEFDPQIYFTTFYDIESEFRLYYIKDKIDCTYKMYSAKQKINLTTEDVLLSKINLRTWQELMVKWELLELDIIPGRIQELAEYTLNKNHIEVWVIEFIRTHHWEYRFLEINCLWGSMMFDGKDEENIKSMILDWWSYLYNKDKYLKWLINL